MTARPSRSRRVLAGVVDFFVGDDWLLAVGVVLVLAVAGLVSRTVSSWWVLVLGVPSVLAVSLRRATRARP